MHPQAYTQDRGKETEVGQREVPQFARDFIQSLRARPFRDDASLIGASAAQRHELETGHRFEKGCCTSPENRCQGCKRVLPKPAKLNRERFCSRACREEHETQL